MKCKKTNSCEMFRCVCLCCPGTRLRLESTQAGDNFMLVVVREEGERGTQCLATQLVNSLEHTTSIPPCASSVCFPLFVGLSIIFGCHCPASLINCDTQVHAHVLHSIGSDFGSLGRLVGCGVIEFAIFQGHVCTWLSSILFSHSH